MLTVAAQPSRSGLRVGRGLGTPQSEDWDPWGKKGSCN